MSQYVALNHVRDKGKPQWKLSYKVLKEEYECDNSIEISSYLTLIKLKYFLAGSTIVLQLFVSDFLIVILLLDFLSQNTIWSTFELMITKQKE